MDTYQIWTVSISRSRNLKEKGIHFLDTTVKSGNRVYAPSWDMVMNYKDGKLSETQYTDLYLHRMKESRQNHPEEWKKLIDYKKVAVGVLLRAR